MKTNYHTHMYLCRHAIGTVEDYVKSAIDNGLTVLGMSDHGPFEELKDRSIRMRPNEFPIYLAECDEAIRKYADRIKIYKGLEIARWKSTPTGSVAECFAHRKAYGTFIPDKNFGNS